MEKVCRMVLRTFQALITVSSYWSILLQWWKRSHRVRSPGPFRILVCSLRTMNSFSHENRNCIYTMTNVLGRGSWYLQVVEGRANFRWQRVNGMEFTFMPYRLWWKVVLWLSWVNLLVRDGLWCAYSWALSAELFSRKHPHSGTSFPFFFLIAPGSGPKFWKFIPSKIIYSKLSA